VKLTVPSYHSCFVVSEIENLVTDSKVIKTENNTLEVFPNPMNQLLKINFGSNLYKKLNINDLSGKTVMSFDVPLQSSDMKINVSGLSKGVYCINLLGNNRSNSKLVIR